VTDALTAKHESMRQMRCCMFYSRWKRWWGGMASSGCLTLSENWRNKRRVRDGNGSRNV